MTQKRTIKKNCLLLVILGGVLGFFLSFNLALAESCPSITTVEGTTVTFVGKLTDMGGDSVTYVWFKYDKTTSLGQKTSEKALTKEGIYCITISGLDPSTTYYYRAGARNSAGTSYGEIKSFTTTAGKIATDFSVNKTVRNLSDGTAFLKSVSADPGDVLTFRIKVKAGDNSLSNIIVKDTLPSGVTFVGDLRIDNILTSGNILVGLNIGNLAAKQEKTITFRADVLDPENFAFGQTRLVNSVLVSSDLISRSDTAEVMVTKAAVAGAVTAIPTGLTNNILFDSFLIPLTIALLAIWLFKSRILKVEEWLDAQKKKYQEYRSDKILRLKIAKIKTEEFFRKKLS